MHLAEINEVIKASPAIQIQSKITHLQRRAWNVLLANAYDELPNKDIHRVSVTELARSLGFNSRDYDHLKETLEALVDCTVEWNILGKDQKEKWGVASLLASAEIENGICTYGFAPHLRYRLYNPRIYTKLNLRLQSQFTSRYALILWEVCFDYFDIARGEGETPFIPLEKFRELMGVGEDDYPVYKELNRNVIKPAIKEINDLTSYAVAVEQKRIGRRIGKLKFKISRAEARHHDDRDRVTSALEAIPEQTQMELFDVPEELPAIAMKLIQAGVSRKEALRISELEWDVVDAAARPVDRKDFAGYVEGKVGLARYATTVKNTGGFIVKAIRENYQNPEFEKQVEAEKAKEREATLSSLEAEMLEKQHALLRQAIRANPALLEQAAAEITSGFIRERLMEYDSVKDAYAAGGVVAGDIHSILAKAFCADLIAPVIEAYEDEKARILGGNSRQL